MLWAAAQHRAIPSSPHLEGIDGLLGGGAVVVRLLCRKHRVLRP